MKLTNTEPWNNSDGKKPPYRELVGALMYLSVTTRPDLAHSTSVLSQFNNNFGTTHWSAAKRILRYLKGSSELGIVQGSSFNQLTGFVDADWGGNVGDGRSYTGFAFTWLVGIISWESKKQSTVALSSTESEYMALTEAAKETVYLRRFLSELGADVPCPTRIINDNISAQRLAENPIFQARTKHIHIRYHFV